VLNPGERARAKVQAAGRRSSRLCLGRCPAAEVDSTSGVDSGPTAQRAGELTSAWGGIPPGRRSPPGPPSTPAAERAPRVSCRFNPGGCGAHAHPGVQPREDPPALQLRRQNSPAALNQRWIENRKPSRGISPNGESRLAQGLRAQARRYAFGLRPSSVAQLRSSRRSRINPSCRTSPSDFAPLIRPSSQ
jgi:hypothetical protein